MSLIRIPGTLVNKANSYRIHRNTKLGTAWVAPSDEAKVYEALVAWHFLKDEKREWIHGEPLQMTIRLINQRHDCDAIKAIGDGIQQSGRIKNDKQFRRIVIEHVDGKEPAVEIEVEPYLTPTAKGTSPDRGGYYAKPRTGIFHCKSKRFSKPPSRQSPDNQR